MSEVKDILIKMDPVLTFRHEGLDGSEVEVTKHPLSEVLLWTDYDSALCAYPDLRALAENVEKSLEAELQEPRAV